MSGWDAYITNLMASSKSITRAAIVGLDGSVWASESELQTFVGLFNRLEEVPGSGCDLEQVHYIVPRTEANLIFGRKGQTGMFAAKSTMAVVIAVFEGETIAAQECRTAVEKMSAYLASSGY